VVLASLRQKRPRKRTVAQLDNGYGTSAVFRLTDVNSLWFSHSSVRKTTRKGRNRETCNGGFYLLPHMPAPGKHLSEAGRRVKPSR